MADQATELSFQNDMIKQLMSNGWLKGEPEHDLNLDTLARYKKNSMSKWSEVDYTGHSSIRNSRITPRLGKCCMNCNSLKFGKIDA